MTQVVEEAPERHASWIELFFDLVVVAGVGQLAHLLSHGPSLADVGLYLLLYLAFWIAWATYTVYGNVAGDRARVPTMLLAMLGLAVMVAAVDGVRDTHTRAFVIAYVALRWLAGGIYGRGAVVVDWPLAQYGTGAVPWFISLFVAERARYWLWTLGVVIDLLVMLALSGDNILRDAQRRLDRVLQRRPGTNRVMPSLHPARTDAGHLSERMGLFVIIVLGEGVVQLLAAASGAVWRLPLDVTALGGFAMLTGLWTLSLLYGFAGVPGLEASALATRHAMALHLATTAAIAALAAGLGTATAHAGTAVPAGTRWLLCAGTAAYFAVSAVGGLLGRAGWAWLLGWALPCVAAPVLLGALGGGLRSGALIWLLVATIAWQTAYTPVMDRRRHPSNTTGD